MYFDYEIKFYYGAFENKCHCRYFIENFVKCFKLLRLNGIDETILSEMKASTRKLNFLLCGAIAIAIKIYFYSRYKINKISLFSFNYFNWSLLGYTFEVHLSKLFKHNLIKFEEILSNDQFYKQKQKHTDS